MEAVKSAIINGVQERHGPCVVQIDEQCMNISVQKHPDHIIYVRQDDRQKQYVCHYVHRADVARRLCGVCTCRIEKFEDVPTTNMEYDDQPFGVRRKRAPVVEPPCLCGLDTDLHAWRQRKAFQLVRTVVRIVFFFFVLLSRLIRISQPGKYNEFAKIAVQFVADAVARIELLADVPEYGRRRMLTFAQARRESELFPRPKPVRKPL